MLALFHAGKYHLWLESSHSWRLKTSDVSAAVVYFTGSIILNVFGYHCRYYDFSAENVLCIVVKSFFLRA